MAAIQTSRGLEFVTLQCQNLLVPHGGLHKISEYRVGFVDVHGRTGVSGLLTEGDQREQKAQETFGNLSGRDIERHNAYMARVSNTTTQQVFWSYTNGEEPQATPESFSTSDGLPVGRVTLREDVGNTWPAWEGKDARRIHAEVSIDEIFLNDQSSGSLRVLNPGPDKDVAYPSNEFSGIMMDSGSTSSVVSEHQLHAYRQATGFSPPLRKSHGRINSMHGHAATKGLAEFRFPFGKSSRSFHAQVSTGDSPLILGIADQRRWGALVDPVTNSVSFGCGTILPLLSARGHLFLYWEPPSEETLYTAAELRRLHRRFGHPSNKKLTDFLMRCDADKMSSEVQNALAEIAAGCSQCQRGARAPVRFRVSIPSDMFEFNREVIVDLFSISGRTAISFVDRDTRFAVCKFMHSNTQVKAKDIWRMLLKYWVFPYSGYPDVLRHDQGTQFVAAELQVVAAEAGISTAAVGIESPNAMGIGERIHGPIRRIYEKILTEHPGLNDPDFLLSAATKSYNDLQGIDGLVPTLLVFGVYPKVPLPGSDSRGLPNHIRLKVIQSSRAEYKKIIDERRLCEALKPDRPTPSLPVGLSHGARVLVYRTTTSRWEPATFLYESGSLVHVRIGRRIQPFAREKVKLAVDDQYEDANDNPAAILDPVFEPSLVDNAVHVPSNPVTAAVSPNAHSQPAELGNPESPHDATPAVATGNFEWNLPSVAEAMDPEPEISPGFPSPAGEFPSLEMETDDDAMIFYATKNAPSVAEIVKIHEQCLATEVISSKDPRSSTFDKAIQLELSGLLEKGVFEEVCVSSDERKRQKLNVLKSRFVLALKEPGTPNEIRKARLVVQAMPHADKDRSHLFTYSPTVTKASFRILLSLAACNGFDVYLRDISQAYVCSEFDLIRDAYIVPPKSLGLPENTLWKLKKPLYGLPESGLLWYETYRSYHEVDLKMDAAVVDPCLYYRHHDSKLMGMIVTQVDDSAIAGTRNFLADELKAAVQFPSKGRKMVTSEGHEFNGSLIRKSGQRFEMDQNAYVARISTAKTERTPEAFATVKGKLHYATSNSRPDHACAINLLSQTLPGSAQEEQFKELDRINAEMHATELGLSYGPLDLESVELCVYSDASFANCPDFRSQLGYVVFMRDKHDCCSLISWASNRSKRVTRSVLAAELFALSHAYDVGFGLRHTLSSLLGREVPLKIYTDSKTLFQSVTNLTSMSEKRLLIDIAVLRDAYRNGDLKHFAHIDTAENPADGMTKPRASSFLVKALRTGKLRHTMNKCVGTGMVPKRR